MKTGVGILLLPLLLVVASPGTPAATFDVDSTADEVDAVPGNGVCATVGGECTLRAAIQEVNALDAGAPHTITVPAGTYTLGIPGQGEDDAATGDLDISRTDTTINGAGAKLTIIDGGNLDRVFETRTCCFKDFYFTGMTIQNGDPGGGNGGGIYVNATRANLTDVTVKNNTAANGGGIESSTSFIGCTNVTISGNTATGQGGGLRNTGFLPTGTLTNVTISGNSAASGGGIRHNGGTADLTNVTLTNNSGTNVVRNGGTINLLNTIVANATTGGNCSGTISSLGYNLDTANTCGFTGPGDLINASANLGALADNGGPTETHALLSGSQARDAVLAGCAPPATDQRGVLRPQGANCDIGAFELTSISIVKRAFQSDGTPLSSGSNPPTGMPVKFLLYINNPDVQRTDVSIQDVLDGAYIYTSGSIRHDNSVAACAAATCTPAEEAAIFAAADGGTAATDAVDGDAASFAGVTLDVGNANAANAQLDIAADSVYAIRFTARMQ